MNAALYSNPKMLRNMVVPALFMATAVFVGCGSEMSTNPIGVKTQSTQSEVGEMVLPGPQPGISSPRNLSAAPSAANVMDVTWAVPQEPYEAVVMRNGVEVARVPALSGGFSDVFPTRTPGINEFTYAVCFARGVRLGPEALIVGVLPRQNSQDSGPTAHSEN